LPISPSSQCLNTPNFIGYNLGLVLGAQIPRLDLTLPLGISFFTFHHIMYLVNLRRGKAPLYQLDRYALYICCRRSPDRWWAGRR